MPERWIDACRRLAPAATRERVFDPVIADLSTDCAERLSCPRSVLARVAIRARFRAAVLAAAFGCYRLAWREAWEPRALGRQVSTEARHALRFLRRQPGFTLAAVLTLGLGVGATTAVFSYVNHLLLAGAPVADPDGLVRVFGRTPEYSYDVVSFPNYRDLRDGVAGLDLAAHVQTPARIGNVTANETRTVELVTGNFFRILRIAPLAGRLIDESDAAAEGSRAVVVVSESVLAHPAWLRSGRDWPTDRPHVIALRNCRRRAGGIPGHVRRTAGRFLGAAQHARPRAAAPAIL